MREVVSLVFGIREAKLTIAKDEGAKVDFFLSIMLTRYLKSTGGRDKFGKLSRYESIENRNFVSEACK